MPKYLLAVSYTSEGARGLLKDGGTKRRAAAQKAIESVGGRLEALYFAFGDSDVVTIVDDALERQPDVYFEAGDHVSLVHMDKFEFARVMKGARHGSFSEPWVPD